MRSSLRALGVMSFLLGMGLWLAPSLAADARHQRGRALFERVWAPTHQQHPEADGLGPLYNERSCVACHSLGGMGGAGPASKNIDLLSPTIRPGDVPQEDFVERLRGVHPAFKSMSNIVLHKFGIDAEPYAEFRLGLVGKLDRSMPTSPARFSSQLRKFQEETQIPLRSVEVQSIRFVWSQRNTTPLFGIGRLGRISVNELKQIAIDQQRENPEISGRFTGRFGWRGQIDQLSEFVRAACATEVGLNVGTHAQALDPLQVAERELPDRKVDLTHQQCSDLTAYIASLPSPRRRPPEDLQHARQIEFGEKVFREVGCAECHRQRLGQVAGIYSDLLLHQMGEGLSDPSPASEGATHMRVQSTRSAYGGESVMFVEGSRKGLREDPRQEWKTPPLWGVRDSGPYLHDGRAATIEEAVLQHGGEATSSAKRFRELSDVERTQLLTFLGSLAAPDPALLR
jgi:CxxC motif-containing protein (DUF1111 family)